MATDPSGPPRPGVDDGPSSQAPPDTAGITSAALLITTARTFQTLVVFVLGVALARRLSQPAYGTFQHVNWIAALVPGLVGAPLGRAVNYHLPRAARGEDVLRRAGAAALAVAVVLGVVVLLWPDVLLVLDRDARLVQHAPEVAAILVLAVPYGMAEPVLLARGERRRAALVLAGVATMLGVAVGGALVFAADALLLRWALRGVAVAYAVQAAAGALALAAPLRDPGGPRPPQGKAPGIGGLVAFTLPLVFAGGAATFAAQVDRLLVPLAYPADRFPGVKALYFRGAMYIPVLSALAVTVENLMSPLIAAAHARGDREALFTTWRHGCRLLALTGIPAAGLVIVTAGDLLPLVYGEPYAESASVLRWYALLLVLHVFSPRLLLESTGGLRASVATAVCGLALAAALGWPLLMTVGWWAAAPATVGAAMAASWGLGGGLARRRLRCRWADLIDVRAVVRVAGAAAVAGVVAALACGAVGAPGRVARVAVGAGVYTSLFAVLAWRLHLVRPDELRRFRERLVRSAGAWPDRS